MARFLFTVWPFPGHFFPLVAIAHALRQAGHECAFYTGAQAGRVVADEGFPCFPFDHLDEARLHRLMFSRREKIWRWKGMRQFQTLMRHWLLDTLPQQVEDLEAILDEWRPEVIACDPTLWGPILILHERLGIAVAVCSFVPACMLPGPDAPPFGPGLPHRREWWARFVWRAAGWAIDVSAINFRRTANALRRRYGLPALTVSVTAYTGQMPLYLVPSVPEFDYARQDLPSSVHYIGPCIWNKPHGEPPAWLLDLPRDQPWVHVTEGTMHTQEPFLLRAAAQGLAGRPVQVIMTTGGNRTPEALDLGLPAPNLRVAAWVSHSDLLPHTDVVITTGGAGTVLAALATGVPLVIVPTEWDKPEIAQRVVAAGAGVRLAPRHCTPERLRASVEHVLSEPSFRQNARRLATIFGGYGGPAQAAALLADLALERSVSLERGADLA
jgi:MGT family glycosyltransferase